ncbi:bZIP transcription factor 17-like [Solanum tuberosum]|uniref:bZIP transcription factor 17-like n=1 Tax=Solanum tuberosum TaxID=4113 RepID=UPI00073A2A51|nr:PREDICTED: bZIP transcription factor 17-like [Solanum tuberosum]
MYPHPPPWMSYTPPYTMKRQGSKVPLVPIPKLKPRAVASVPKSSKKVQKKKSEVGSFIESEIWRYERETFMSATGYFGKYGGKYYSSHCGQGGQGESNQQNTNKAADEFVHVSNGSDSPAASLCIPRINKLVEIYGNSTIQFVLASEKAMSSHGSADKKNREADLAIPGRFRPCYPTNPSSPLSKSFNRTKDSWIRREEKCKVNYTAK